ncbi:hypothetical protein G6F32_015332 [Rhizopus arrhizus]|nr:hypothetical protein G6F32_015332 [Rhizopus arrhizus]
MPSLPPHDSASAAEIALAAQRLLDGELAAVPTETGYGLGADAERRRVVLGGRGAARGTPAERRVLARSVDVDPQARAAHCGHGQRRAGQHRHPLPVASCRAGAAGGIRRGQAERAGRRGGAVGQQVRPGIADARRARAP